MITKQIGMRFLWNDVRCREAWFSVTLTTGKQATLLYKKFLVYDAVDSESGCQVVNTRATREIK